MRRIVLPLTLIAGLSGTVHAQEKLADRVDARLEDTVTDLLPALIPENASADPHSGYRRALDAVDAFLLADVHDKLEQRCIAALLRNIAVPHHSYGGVDINTRVWNALEREGVANYSHRLQRLAELSRDALGEAGRAATLHRDSSSIDSLEQYVRTLHTHARDMLRGAAVVQPLPRTYTADELEDIAEIITSQKAAYDELIAIRDAAQKNDPAVYDKLKDWKKDQAERFDALLALQRRAFDAVDANWQTISTPDGDRVVPQRFARQWDGMQQSVADIERRLGGFDGLRNYLTDISIGDTIHFTVGYAAEGVLIDGRYPKSREAVIPLELSRAFGIGAQFQVQFGGGGNSNSYTVVGIGDGLYLGSDPQKIPPLHGATGAYTHRKFAPGAHFVLLKNPTWD